MARATVWRRGTVAALVGNRDVSYVLCTLAPGETLTRVRLHIDTSTLSANEYVTSGVPFCWGVWLDPFGTGPTLDPTIDFNSQEWLWWEGISLRNQVAEGAGPAKYVDSGPQEGGYRDIRAMRKAGTPSGSYVWFRLVLDAVVSGISPYTSLTWSCLVTLP